MGVRNESQVTEFILLGFSGVSNSSMYVFLPFLAIYMVTVLGNLTIFSLIQLDPSLHTPMYYFLSHLSCLDICISSVTVPKILVNFLRQRQTISYNQCMAQIFFFVSFTGTEAALLAVMAYDRYAAICKPLHYSHLMNAKVCGLLAVATWIWGPLDSVLHTVLTSKLNFCDANQIEHIFCDPPPLIKIACGDTQMNKMISYAASVILGLSPFLVVILSYFYILSSVLRVHSNTRKQKALSTCTSHIMVVTIYFGSGLLNYNHPTTGYSVETATLVSIIYSIVPSMLNPLIYSLRNKEVKGALQKVIRRQ